MIPNLHHAVCTIQLLMQRVFPSESIGKPMLAFYTDNGQYVANVMLTADARPPFNGNQWGLKSGAEFKGVGTSYENAAQQIVDRLVSQLKEKQEEDLQVLNLVDFTKRLNNVETKGTNPPTFELPVLR